VINSADLLADTIGQEIAARSVVKVAPDRHTSI
jgi:hypothetical protein